MGVVRCRPIAQATFVVHAIVSTLVTVCISVTVEAIATAADVIVGTAFAAPASLVTLDPVMVEPGDSWVPDIIPLDVFAAVALVPPGVVTAAGGVAGVTVLVSVGKAAVGVQFEAPVAVRVQFEPPAASDVAGVELVGVVCPTELVLKVVSSKGTVSVRVVEALVVVNRLVLVWTISWAHPMVPFISSSISGSASPPEISA
jgi:hypothetical protein